LDIDVSNYKRSGKASRPEQVKRPNAWRRRKKNKKKKRRSMMMVMMLIMMVMMKI
jgi:hypothetical protein